MSRAWTTQYVQITVICMHVLMGPSALVSKLFWLANQKYRVKAGMAGKPIKKTALAWDYNIKLTGT